MRRKIQAAIYVFYSTTQPYKNKQNTTNLKSLINIFNYNYLRKVTNHNNMLTTGLEFTKSKPNTREKESK